MPLGVCNALIIKCAGTEGSVAVYIELSLICVCTNTKTNPRAVHVLRVYAGSSERGWGV